MLTKTLVPKTRYSLAVKFWILCERKSIRSPATLAKLHLAKLAGVRDAIGLPQGGNQWSDCADSSVFLANLGMFPYFDKVDPHRGERFALGMAGSELIRPLTEDVYPFHELLDGAKVVDVGGGRGQVSIRIAEKVPHLSFVVQDQASVVESVLSEGGLDEMDDRVQFQAHNFFTTEPVKGADAYLFRFILHDHPDRYASECSSDNQHVLILCSSPDSHSSSDI